MYVLLTFRESLLFINQLLTRISSEFINLNIVSYDLCDKKKFVSSAKSKKCILINMILIHVVKPFLPGYKITMSLLEPTFYDRLQFCYIIKWPGAIGPHTIMLRRAPKFQVYGPDSDN